MKKHKHFHTFRAHTHYDLGFQMGQAFQAEAHRAYSLRDSLWQHRMGTAAKLLPFAQKFFPQYIDELKGYADGAKLDFSSFWTLSLEDDAFVPKKNQNYSRCTSLITNEGLLLAHNEDSFEPGHKDDVCIVQKEIGNYTSIEIFYYNTLGGTSISVNSHGFAQSINTLLFTQKQIGVPKTMAERLLMDTSDPEKDITYLKNLKRASGANHNIVSQSGKVWNVEFTSTKAKVSTPKVPFGHSNHCLRSDGQPLKRDSYGTVTRLRTVEKLAKSSMSENQIIQVMDNTEQGSFLSVMNERTIGKMIIHFKTKLAKIWLLREDELGWVDYPLTFLR